jgi:hypothetical protein
MKELAETLQMLYTAFDSKKEHIYELSMVSDLMRVEGDAQATATAESIKASAGINRTKPWRKEVARFTREIYTIAGEIIAKHFQDDTIALMGGVNLLDPQSQALFPQALALLRDDELRTFRIDIETAQTLMVDENEDKQTAIEYLNTVTDALTKFGQISQTAQPFSAAMGQTILAVTRRFNFGRALETSWEQAIDDQLKALEQAKGKPPPPSPEQQKAQADIQIAQMKAQAQQQIEQAQAQADMAVAQQKAQLDMQIADRKAQRDVALDNMKMRIEMMKEQAKASVASEKMRFEMALKKMEAQYQMMLEAQKLRGEMAADHIHTQHKLQLEQVNAAHDRKLSEAELKFKAGSEGAEKKREGKGESSSGPVPQNLHFHIGGEKKKAVIKRTASGDSMLEEV